ncbi:beta-galactosidase [Flavitalea sp. BT771]|nr:beta-galactosidase [Flavitalea sp. BT771]MDV6219569.1 beta-galactosidase [Flavitalea sp. BT771]
MACSIPGYAQPRHSFALGDSVFLLDNRPFQMICGEMHYARIPREAWRQRMKMAKAMGLNTIGTYVFWNIQEPEKGKFDFSGNNDIAAFVRTAQEESLWVVLRPSPYVCAEWEFGGYPYWLQNENGLVVRSKEQKYLNEYKQYLMALGKQLAPLQVNHGGNILMIQVENEYGSYGDNREYLEINRKIFQKAGFDGLLFTADQANDVARGFLPGSLPALNGIDNPQRIRQLVRRYNNGKGPYYVAEWYPAWFDWWGSPHHVVPPEKYTAQLDSMLSAGISVNMYMFHGGTTRGFMNGANYNDKSPYEPQISSYDYDAPLDEAGNATPKFMAFRSVIQKHLPPGQTLPDVPAAKPAISIDDIQFRETTGIFNILSSPKINQRLLTFEDLHQAYGFVLYRTKLNGGAKGKLAVMGLRDYALVFINGRRAGILDRRLGDSSINVEMPQGSVTLDILVENLGRINFGPYLLNNKKGITQKVLFNNQELENWQMFSLPLDDINAIKRSAAAKKYTEAPVLRRGNFNLVKTGDSYLDMSRWGKGVVWVNGYNLGRYWNVGPQQTIYVPGEWLKPGNNEIVVLELIKPQQAILRGIEKPSLSN